MGGAFLSDWTDQEPWESSIKICAQTGGIGDASCYEKHLSDTALIHFMRYIRWSIFSEA